MVDVCCMFRGKNIITVLFLVRSCVLFVRYTMSSTFKDPSHSATAEALHVFALLIPSANPKMKSCFDGGFPLEYL